jgi:SAM-dependent methyltransferase
MMDVKTQVPGRLYEVVCCPVCDEEGRPLALGARPPTQYRRCGRCKTIFASPRTPVTTRLAWLNRTFSADGPGSALAPRRLRALEKEAAIIRGTGRVGRLLDVGCNTGDFFQFFPRPEWSLHGVELAPSSAKYAADTHRADVRTGQLRDANYPVGYFDVVTMIDVFYYFDSPREILGEARRILKDDGLLAIELAGQAYTLLRGNWLVSRILHDRRPRFASDSSYLNWLARPGLEELLRRCGFRVVRCHPIPSPDGSGLAGVLGSAYSSAATVLVANWPALSDWSPKYLCLAAPANG